MAAPDSDEIVSETSPLLNNQQQQHHDGIANGNAASSEDSNESGAHEVALAEEISTKKLLAIMGAIWIGVYFAALGMYRKHSHMV